MPLRPNKQPKGAKNPDGRRTNASDHFPAMSCVLWAEMAASSSVANIICIF